MFGNAKSYLIVAVLLLSGAAVLIPSEPQAPTENAPVHVTQETQTRVDPYSNLNFQGEVDLATDAQVTFLGKKGGTLGDQAGYNIASGDIDKDGKNELFLSAPNAPYDQTTSPPEIGPGEVYVYFGRDRESFDATFDIATNPPNITISAVQPSLNVDGRIGNKVLISDVNGDGYGDILIGEPKYFASSGDVKGVGRLYILFGRPTASFKSTYDLYTEADASFWFHKYETAAVGTEITSTDFDNDGYNDIIVGAPGWDSVFIIFGRATFPSSDMSYPGTGIVMISCGSNALLATGFGNALDSGDINQDGYGDIIAGTHTWDSKNGSVSETGRVYVIMGRPRVQFPNNVTIIFDLSFPYAPVPITLTNTNLLWDVANLTIFGEDLRDYLGTDVALGDMDNDGYPDMFMTAPGGDGRNNSANDTGEASLFKGSEYISFGLGPVGDPQNMPKYFSVAEIRDMIIYGGKDGDRSGYSAYMSDLDGDGYSDLQYSAPQADGPDGIRTDCGQTYLEFGRATLPKTVNISKKEVDLIIYGAGGSDMLGSCVSSADMDQDGYTDIMVSANYADGPGNTRKNCGETYILFGSGLRAKGFALTDGYDLSKQSDGGKTCFAGKKSYSMRLQLSDSLGLADLSTVKLVLDPEGSDLEFVYNQTTGAFTTLKDASGYTSLDATGSSAQASGPLITLTYKIQFDWDYPTQAIQGAKVLITNDTGVKVQSRYLDVYDVESDLGIIGDLAVTHSTAGDVSLNGSWCPASGEVSWTGLKVVYEGTQAVYPPDDAFNIRISGAGGQWYQNASSGLDLEMVTPSPPKSADPLGVRYDLDITDRLGASQDTTDIWHYLRTDATGPLAPTGLQIHPDDLEGPTGTIDDDRDVFVTWNRVTDVTCDAGNMDGVGISKYYYSTVLGSGTTAGNESWEAGGLTGYYYNTGNFYNLTYAGTEPTLSPDWGMWSPNDALMDADNFSARYVGRIYMPQTTTYTLYIYADDGAKVWIDQELIYDQWKPPNPMQVIRLYQTGMHDIRIDYRDLKGNAELQVQWEYGAQGRSDIPSANLYHAALNAEVLDLFEGKNTIYVWASDLLGNIGTAGSVDIYVDTTGPHFIEPIMDTQAWHTQSEVAVGITVADNGSGASDDIAYAISTDGLSGFGAWQKVPFGILKQHNSTNDWLVFNFSQVFDDGADNYIKFRAKDKLGNGYTESIAYNIKIDTKEVTWQFDLPVNNSVLATTNVTFNATVSDPEGSGIVQSMVEYMFILPRADTTPIWKQVPLEYQYLYGEGRHDRINLSIEVPNLPESSNYWIQFRAKDAAGNGWTYSKNICFTVDIPIINLAPKAVISYPLNNASFYRGDPILMDASNSTDDGLLEPLSFNWYSSWDKAIGSGEKLVLTKELRIGQHYITLYVSDGEHNVSTSVTITIMKPLDNTEPVNPEDPDAKNDTDNDNMLDAWEVEHFGNINVSNGKGDTDKDGYSDYMEYLYDTDPKDKSDKPPVALPADDDDSGTSNMNYIWLLVAIGFVVLIVIAGVFTFFLNKKNKEQELKDDNMMVMRQKTTSDVMMDQRPADEAYDDPERDRRIVEEAAERRRLYNERIAGKSKRGKGRKGRKNAVDAEQMSPDATGLETGTPLAELPEAAQGTQPDEFGEKEMDLSTFDEDLEKELGIGEEPKTDGPEVAEDSDEDVNWGEEETATKKDDVQSRSPGKTPPKGKGNRNRT